MDVLIVDAAARKAFGPANVGEPGYGMGGSEYAIIQLARALRVRGVDVGVRRRMGRAENDDDGTHWDNFNDSGDLGGLHVKCAILSRSTPLPKGLRADRVLISATDNETFPVPFGAQVVCVSSWQTRLFWSGPVRVIPSMIDDYVYELREEKDPSLFVYASAADKGAAQTMRAWDELRKDLPGARLVMTTTGYDTPDLELAKVCGVEWVGHKSPGELVGLLAKASAYFYINCRDETFGVAPAIAEALGCRMHVGLATETGGALPEVLASPLLTRDPEVFAEQVIEAYRAPDDPKWLAQQGCNYSVSRVMPLWLDAMGLR